MNQKPNILFFFSDQHSGEFLNSDRVDTPNLNRLCWEGTYFTNAYSQNPLCVPSRCSMLTGRYSRNLGIYENRHILEANCTTIPRVLAENGYRTCLVGKSHFNGEQFHGYQQRPYGDLFGQAHQSEYIRTKDNMTEDQCALGNLILNSGATAIPLPMTQTEICVSESVKWLQQYASTSQKEPFFLSVNFDKPHFPLRAPKKFFDKYKDRAKLENSAEEDYMQKQAVEFVRSLFEFNKGWSQFADDKEAQQNALAAYYACIEWVDDAIGRIMECLDYLGLRENTLVIYSSDHGEMAGEKNCWQKTLFFDRSAKVPLVFNMPGQVGENVKNTSLTGLLDLFPTICDVAGVEIPDTCDGVSLAPILRGEKKSVRDSIFSESVLLRVPEHAGCMLRDGDYKYNYYLRGDHELYNMAEDSHENHNLIHDPAYAEICSSMRDRIEKFWEPEKQIQRYMECPCMQREKHFYFSSNQFLAGDGSYFDAKP